jgi:hypothetical protein
MSCKGTMCCNCGGPVIVGVSTVEERREGVYNISLKNERLCAKCLLWRILNMPPGMAVVVEKIKEVK